MAKKIKYYFLCICFLIIGFYISGCEKEETITDITSPVITNVKYFVNDTSSVTIRWTTNEPATSQVKYASVLLGHAPNYIYTNEDNNLVFEHAVVIDNLSGGQEYIGQVISKDKTGNISMSSEFYFATTKIIMLIEYKF